LTPEGIASRNNSAVETLVNKQPERECKEKILKTQEKVNRKKPEL